MTMAFSYVPRADLEPAAAALHDSILETRAEVAPQIGLVGPDGSMRGPFAPLLRTPATGDLVQRLGTSLKVDTTLSAEVFEVVALTVSHEWKCAFEWAAHSRLAVESGALTAADVERIAEGRAPNGRDAAAAWTFAIQQCRLEQVDAQTVDDALASLGERGVVELAVATGYYILICMLLRTCEPRQVG